MNKNKIFETAQRMKERYPVGTMVEIHHISDEYIKCPAGTKAKVELVDDIGQLHTVTEDGKKYTLIEEIDDFKKV